MDGQPDMVSFGPRRRRGARGPWRRVIAIVVLALCLGVIPYLALLASHQHGTINDLRTALRKARDTAPDTTAGPLVSGSATYRLPGAAGGSLSVVAMAIRSGAGSPARTWLFVYGRHADPGERYGLLEDTCGGQYVTASDLADGTADRQGDLTIIAPDLALSSRDPDVWILVYRSGDGVPLGGVQGPLIGRGARTFRAAPRC